MIGDLTTLASVKAWIPVTTSNDDDLLTALVTRASTFVQSWLNRTIASQAYTEVRNGQGMPVMLLQNYPISAVNSLTIDGIAIPPRSPLGSVTFNNAAGYTFDANAVYLSGWTFCSGFQNIAVSYVAGFADTPADIEQATNMIITDWYRNLRGSRAGVASESIEGQSISFLKENMPEAAQLILLQYKKVAPI